jgi:riboflavin biosynthesis pyrimidine reductase
LLVEGGPTLHDAFARAGLVDRVQRISTPHVLSDGVREADVTRAFASADAHGARRWLGPDEFIEADVHRID